jgi:hypothetical protein
LESIYSICPGSEGGATIPDSTVTALHQKILAMKGVALFLFLVIYTIVMTTLISPALQQFGLPEENGFSFLFTFLFSLTGVGLAIIYVQIKKLSRSIQRYLKIGLFTIYPLMLFITYVVFGVEVFFTLCVVLLKLIFVLLIGALPLIFTYGFLQKMRIAVLAPSVGLIFLFFLTLLLSNTENRFVITPDEPWSFVLFFIGYLLFFELATDSLFFSEVIEKIKPEKTQNEFMANRFSMMLNSYGSHLAFAIVICMVCTGGIVLLKEIFLSTYVSNVMGLDFGSISGIYLFVLIMICSVLLFLLFSPMKKAAKKMGSVYKKESQ